MALIETDPEVQHGEPVIRGTRITASTIAAIAEQGTPVEVILRHYPTLSEEQIEAARLHTRAHPRPARPSLPQRGEIVLALSADELQGT